MTQEQAKAIAEREYPINYVTDTDNIILCEKLKRKAYAKALMDMNPLIEAAHGLRWVAQCADDGHKDGILRIHLHPDGSMEPERCEFCGRRQQSMDDYDTALLHFA